MAFLLAEFSDIKTELLYELCNITHKVKVNI